MIIRTSPRHSFTALPNAIFRDKRLSLDSKGLLAYLLSLTPNWEIRPQLIAKQMSPAGGRPIGRERLQRMFGELKAAGYMAKSKDQSHRDGGYWGSFTYIVGADPKTVEEEAAVSGVVFQPQLALPSAAEPSAGQPSTANPHTDKRIKEKNNIKLQNPPSPRGERVVYVARQRSNGILEARDSILEDIKRGTQQAKLPATSCERTEFQFADAALSDSSSSGLPTKEWKARQGSARYNLSFAQEPKSSRIFNRDRGRIELEIAQRIGPNGFEVLMALPSHQVDQLCAQQRSGTLDQAALDRALGNLSLSRPDG
jgi:hypothetical protein